MAVQVTYYVGNKLTSLKPSITRSRLLNFIITLLSPYYVRNIIEDEKIDLTLMQTNGTLEYINKTSQKAEITFLISAEDELTPVLDEMEKLINDGHKVILQLPTKLMHLRHIKRLHSEKLIKIQLQIVA